MLDTQYEDGHSAIEARLTERLGDAGRKIHTGRSRNDQILVATRLWLKEKLQRVARISAEVAKVALDRAQAEKDLPIPGYTHIQRAVVSSAGMWWAGWAEAFIDNATRARDTFALVDANPLGTAAGYGVNLPLDREHTTAALGFARMQISPIYAQLSRGKFELAALEALGGATLDLRRIAWDLSLFTSAEFGFVALPAQYTTGSSIMPNKRNPDVIELMRATHASVAAARTEIEQLLSLPSGYHRDLQSSKGAIFHGFGRGLSALELLPALLANLDADALAACVPAELPRVTDRTLATREALYQELDLVRLMGLGQDLEEVATGLVCYAAYIGVTPLGKRVAVSTSIPTDRLDDAHRRDVMEGIRQVARDIALRVIPAA
ncbi:hypothetical protein G6F57_016372 [Rhizopus arrhizus]|nr:hypothetical protein G6F57_016372 [Rhizopus arrhizus]